jgi:hypothetical protein
MARIFNISMVFLLFLFFLNSIFFFSGLTGLGKRVRFASVSGFFGWLLIISVLGVIAYMFYISGFNTSVFLSLQDAFSGQVKQYLIIPGFILGLIGAIIFLFESFILLSSSKTFE